jgi:hypothetical protein
VTDKLIKITTALAVIAVAGVAAIISYQHAYELVRSHGEAGVTARLLPFTVDGLIWAASMVVLDASRRNHRVPRMAACSLGAGIEAAVGANLAHGLGHGPIGAVVSAWPALALVGSFELLMLLIKNQHQDGAGPSADAAPDQSAGPAPRAEHPACAHANLCADLDGQMRWLAGQLGITIPERAWPPLVRAARFEHMSRNADQLVPAPGLFKSNAAFFRRGSSGEGREILTGAELAGYHARVAGMAPPDMLAWLHSPRPGAVTAKP